MLPAVCTPQLFAVVLRESGQQLSREKQEQAIKTRVSARSRMHAIVVTSSGFAALLRTAYCEAFSVRKSAWIVGSHPTGSPFRRPTQRQNVG
jgi:hypothetical protein